MKNLSARQIGAIAFLLLVMGYLTWGIYKNLVTDPDSKYIHASCVLASVLFFTLAYVRATRNFIAAYSVPVKAIGFGIIAAGLLEIIYVFVTISSRHIVPFGKNLSVALGLAPILVGQMIVMMHGAIRRYNERIAAIDKQG